MSEITELRLSLSAEDERGIFGENDSYIRKIEDSFHVEIIDRNGELHIIGDKEGAGKAASIIRELVQLYRRGGGIEEQSINYAITLKEEEKSSSKPRYSENVLVDIDKDVIAIAIARYVFPVPAGPSPNTIILFRIASIYFFWPIVLGFIGLPDIVWQITSLSISTRTFSL